MSKVLMILASALFAAPALATTNASEEVLKVARMNITMYGFYRIGQLSELNEKQICGMAGQAAAGFQIFKAAGLTEKDIETQLGGLAEFKITAKMVEDKLLEDYENCIN